MPKSLKARKESSKKETKEGRMSKEGLNPFRKSTRTERSTNRSEEENLTKKIEKEMKTILRKMREKGQVEKADWMKRMKMIEEKMVQREKKERKNNVIITGIGGISGMVRKRDRGESECKGNI
jgi:hypothetical protein